MIASNVTHAKCIFEKKQRKKETVELSKRTTTTQISNTDPAKQTTQFVENATKEN